MSIFSKLFGKKQTEGEETSHVGGMEDFMTLIRVYYQSVYRPKTTSWELLRNHAAKRC